MSALLLAAHRIAELRTEGVGICMACLRLQPAPSGWSLMRCAGCELYEIASLEEAMHAGVVDVLPGEDN